MMVSAEPAGYDREQLSAFHELLPTLARALDVRDIFQHFSTTAGRIVPHDEANLALLTPDGSQFRLYASTRDGAPELVCRKCARLIYPSQTMPRYRRDLEKAQKIRVGLGGRPGVGSAWGPKPPNMTSPGHSR